MPSTAAGFMRVRVDRSAHVVAVGESPTSGSRRDACPAARPSGTRRRARARRSRRAARTRGARRGCRSRRPARPRARPRCARRCATSTPKPSSPRKMLPIPATSTSVVTAHLEAQRLDLVGVEVEVAALPVEHLGRGSSSTVDRDVLLAVDVVEHPGHGGAPCPARNMSCASARRDGRSRTLVPFATSTPAITRCRSTGRRRRRRRVPPRQRSSAGRRRSRGASDADRAVQSLPHLGRHVVEAVDDRGGARIGAAGLGLLVVGQRQHAQREDLVDLGRVEQVARALGRDRRVVVQDDRRRQHDVGARPRRRSAPGTCRRSCTMRPRRARRSGGSSSDTNAPSSIASSVCTATSDRRTTSSRGASGPHHRSWCSRRVTATFSSAPGPSAHSAATRTRASTARRRGDPARRRRRRRASTSIVVARRRAWTRSVRAAPAVGSSGDRRDVDLALDGLVPRHPARDRRRRARPLGTKPIAGVARLDACAAAPGGSGPARAAGLDAGIDDDSVRIADALRAPSAST